MLEEQNNPEQFFLPKNVSTYETEITQLQKKIDVLKKENEALQKKVEQYENELFILDNLELPEPFIIEQELEEEKVIHNDELNSKGNVSRETFQKLNFPYVEDLTDLEESTESGKIIKSQLQQSSYFNKEKVKEQLEFCLKIAELDSHRCRMELERLVDELE